MIKPLTDCCSRILSLATRRILKDYIDWYHDNISEKEASCSRLNIPDKDMVFPVG